MQLKTARRKAFSYTLLDPMSHPLSLAMHHRVVGVAGKPTMRYLPPYPPIERIMHEEIQDQRAYAAALWRAAIPAPEFSCLAHRRRLQPPFDIQQRPFAVRMLPQCLHDQTVVESVKRSFDVKLQHPVEPPTSLARHPNRVYR